MAKISETYKPVPVRIAELHTKHDDASIQTTVTVYPAEGAAVVRAEIYIGGKLKATGHDSTTELGDDKAIAKAETGAIGRALHNAGFLADEANLENGASGSDETEERQERKSKSFGRNNGSKGFAPKRSAQEDTEEEDAEEAEEASSEEDSSEESSSEAAPEKEASGTALNDKAKGLLAKYGMNKGKTNGNGTSSLRR